MEKKANSGEFAIIQACPTNLLHYDRDVLSRLRFHSYLIGSVSKHNRFALRNSNNPAAIEKVVPWLYFESISYFKKFS